MNYLISILDGFNINDVESKLQAIGFETNLLLPMTGIITGEYTGDRIDLKVEGVSYIEDERPVKQVTYEDINKSEGIDTV